MIGLSFINKHMTYKYIIFAIIMCLFIWLILGTPPLKLTYYFGILYTSSFRILLALPSFRKTIFFFYGGVSQCVSVLWQVG